MWLLIGEVHSRVPGEHHTSYTRGCHRKHPVSHQSPQNMFKLRWRITSPSTGAETIPTLVSTSPDYDTSHTQDDDHDGLNQHNTTSTAVSAYCMLSTLRSQKCRHLFATFVIIWADLLDGKISCLLVSYFVVCYCYMSLFFSVVGEDKYKTILHQKMDVAYFLCQVCLSEYTL